MKKILLCLLSAVLTFNLSAQAEKFLVKEVKADANSLNIPYKQYKLTNGLNVIIHEDHSDPIVHVEVTYNVGSSNESMGKSGFAHLFEHMMFQGSGYVADEEHFKIIQGAGGELNGTTDRDRTNYYETLPSNYLETALYLESDRMGYLLDSLTQKKFEVQRATVKNEKGQSYGVPYGMVGEVKDLALYGSDGHPYSWPVIGYTDDLDRVTSEDVKKFFLRWYGPNNATIVIAGDVDPNTAFDLVNKYFGKLNKSPDVVSIKAPAVRLPEEVIKTFSDWVYFPLVSYTLPTVPRFHKDEPALDVLSELMGGNRKSIFYKTFIDKRDDYLQASVGHPTFRLGGEFSIRVVSYPGYDLTKQLKQTRDMINSAIIDFEKVDFSEEELQAAIMSNISSYYSAGESIAEKSTWLSMFQVFDQQDVNMQTLIDEYKKVTKEDVMRVYNKYIKGKNAAIVQVIPDPKQMDPNAKYKPVESFNQYANVTEDPKDRQYNGLTYNRSEDGIDRTVRPIVETGKSANVPEFWQVKFDNGLVVSGTDNPDSEKINMFINIKGGQLMESNNAYPLGTASMMAGMMNDGTQKYSSEEIEFELAKLGANINFGGGKSGVSGSMGCFTNDFATSMKLLEERLLYPSFDKKQFDKNKKATLQNFSGDKNSSSTMSSKGWSKIIFGDNSILGESISGNPSSVSKISTNTLSEFHANNISPDVTNIVVVGNISKEEFLKHADFLKTWKAKGVKMPSPEELPEYVTNQVFMIDNPSAKQTQMRIGYRTIPYDAFGDYYKVDIANFALGGSFNSRINLSLREEHGWTYGARSFQTAGLDSMPGYFAVSGSIKREATDSAIKEVLNIMYNFYVNGITEEELAFTKSALMSSDALSYEGAYGKAGYLSNVNQRNLPPDYRKQQIEILNAMTVADVNAIIKKHIRPEEMVVFVVGNKYYIGKGISDLGLGKPMMLKPDGSGNKKPKKKPTKKTVEKKGGDAKMFPAN